LPKDPVNLTWEDTNLNAVKNAFYSYGWDNALGTSPKEWNRTIPVPETPYNRVRICSKELIERKDRYFKMEQKG